MNSTTNIIAEQLNGGREFVYENHDLTTLTVDKLREMIAESLHIPKKTILLRLRKDIENFKNADKT